MGILLLETVSVAFQLNRIPSRRPFRQSTEFDRLLQMRISLRPVVLPISMFNSQIARGSRCPRSVYSESVADETNLWTGAHRYRLE